MVDGIACVKMQMFLKTIKRTGVIMRKDMGIDLGTANTLVNIRKKGIVLREPSVVAMDKNSGEVLAVGNEAKEMIGRTPGTVVALRPLKDGVIANFHVTEKMMKYFFKQVSASSFFLFSPRVIVGVPSDVTEVEKRAVVEAALSAGAREAILISEAMASALGAGLPVVEPTGSMVVDIGGGTTEIAVISLGGIVVSRSIRVGGDDMDEAIIHYIRKEYNLMIGDRTAEMIKLEVGNAYPSKQIKKMEITGRNLLTGLPDHVVITSEQIREALSEVLETIVEGVKSALEITPPELSSDIMEKGIVLTGGGSLLNEFDKLISIETGMPTNISNHALDCVAIGTGLAFENYDVLKNVFMSSKKL